MAIMETKVGPNIVADGAGLGQAMRGSREGAGVVATLHGAYTEGARYGMYMCGANAVAGVAPGTALSTTPPLALWNPPSSGRKLSLLKCSMGYVSGTLGAGSVVLAAVLSQTTVPTTGTELVPVCTDLGMPRGVGRLFTGSTWVSVPQILYPVISMGAFLATTAVPPWDTIDVVDGSLVLEPGSGVMLQGVAAAGTSPLVIFGMVWEELML
jgi:hypothetical protein